MRFLDRGRRIAFSDLHRAPADALPGARDAMLARLHAREDGELRSGAAAFAAMWRAIPLLRPLGLLARRPVVLRWLDRVYAHFLRLRPSIRRWLR
jgi:predicted DCC family thiol-disulfide oxidoreductase YuxK